MAADTELETFMMEMEQSATLLVMTWCTMNSGPSLWMTASIRFFAWYPSITIAHHWNAGR